MKTSCYVLAATAILKAAQGQTEASAAPCAIVSESAAVALASASSAAAAGQTGSPDPFVSSQLAQQCLDTVPIVKDDALKYIDGMIPFISFQSTLAHLKNPPKTYQLPAVDIIGSLAKVRENVTNDVYKGEHALQSEMFDLLLSAHDGHLNWYGDMISTAFTFTYPWNLVSVSEDGQKEPSVYASYDLIANSTDPKIISSTFQAASPIVEINGQPVVSFLEELSMRQRWTLDRDASYNTLFWSKAQNGTGGFLPLDLSRSPGDNSTLKFANSSIHTYPNLATVNKFDGVVDGPSFYAKYCTGHPLELPLDQGGDPFQKRQAGGSSQTPRAPPGYPDPLQIHSKYKVGGYYLEGPGLDAIAVLSIPSFTGGETGPDELEFQRVVQDFLAQAKADKKTRLVVDLQANTGGSVAQGFDVFLQLFPNIDPLNLNNWRAHSGLDVMGRAINKRLMDVAKTPNLDFQTALQSGGYVPLFLDNNKAENGSAFTSWDQLYNPQTVNNDQFTVLHQWNISSPFWPNPIQITTTGSRTNWTTPQFKAEDVIMVTDGFCGSTCSVFAELMKTQAKVKSYTFGGRPDNKGAIQAVGGVRGGNVQPWAGIGTFLGLATNLTTRDPLPNDPRAIPPDVEAQIDELVKSNFSDTDLANMTVYALRRSPRARVNFMNAIRPHDAELTPTQFIYDAADCRLWYTPTMINDVTEIWRVAANAAWSNNSLCVAGSTGDPTSISGGYSLSNSSGTASPAPPTPPTPSATKPAVGKSAASRQTTGGIVAIILTIMAGLCSL